MQKYLRQLKDFEKYVEWVALGLGALFLLYIAWAYGISKPVAVQIDGQTLTPANADDYVNERAGRSVRQKVESRNVPEFPTPEFVQNFEEKMKIAIASNVPAPYSPPLLDQLPLSNPLQSQDLNVKVTALPEIPAPRLVDVVTYRGQIVPPLIPKMQPTALMPGMGAVPGQMLPMQPMQMLPQLNTQPLMIPPGPPQPGQPIIKVEDKTCITVFGRFDEGALKKAFEAAKIPPFLDRRDYLAVELQREELLPNGNWGDATIVPPLPMFAPPFDRKKPDQAQLYLQWATMPEVQNIILTPPFYQTVNVAWQIPVLMLQPEQLLALNQNAVQFDPMQIANELHQLDLVQPGQILTAQEKAMRAARKAQILARLQTDEQKALVAKAKAALEEAERRQRAQQRQSERPQPGQPRQPRQPTGRTGGRAPGSANQDETTLNRMYAQVYVPPGGVGGPGVGPGAQPGVTGPVTIKLPPGTIMDPTTGELRTTIDVGNYQPVRPLGNLNQNVDPNAAMFDPRLAQVVFPEFDIWAHDETALPGRVYRYRLRLIVKNPLYQTNVGADPKLNEPLELPVEPDKGWSEWTKPVNVRSKVQMFLAGGAVGGGNSVRFDIYTWQKGTTSKKADVIVGPGDMVGALDAKSGIDFTTGWTVADIRPLADKDVRVTLIDESGRQDVRYLRADQTNKEREKIEDEMRPRFDPNNPTGVPMPGMPGYPGGGVPTYPRPMTGGPQQS